MGQGVGPPAGGRKKLLLSTGEHGYPVLGHPNPTSKSLFIPVSPEYLEKAPHILRFFLLDIQLPFLYS